MTVRPAFETILEHDGAVVMLRASLRAAVAIDNLPGGFPQVWEQIARQSLSTIRAVLLATATDRQDAQRFLAATADKPLASFLADAQAACLAVLAALLKAGDDSAANAPSQGRASDKPMSLNEYHKTLFQYATGWLGWSPAETWNASPAEIEAAFEAHVDRLVKLTPGLSDAHDTGSARPTTTNEYTPERLREIENLGYDPAFDRQALRQLQARNQ
ncbi:hypothetical protein GIY56_00610 [Paracoccus sp. YIM 132242]|uniref:Phage tail assembly chaperone n=1 Tax=Paracoccus lichenicola TaxID=2665644 RepID=A0A6L6HL52_9RHOB|nr:hypothetical protein [Paracoccus lichenicola]MTD98784.1 hypothetical protein [Paracoccus lichenicola]